MVQTLSNVVSHPATPAIGSISALQVMPPVHDTTTAVMQIITFIVGILPSIVKIFKTKKTTVRNEKK